MTKSPTKKVNSSTVSRKFKKIETKTTDYFRKNKLRYDDMLDPNKIKLAETLEKWAEEDSKAYLMTQFFVGMKITKNEFYKWINQYSHLAFAYEMAKYYIVNRREMTMIEKDPSSLRYPHPHYSEIWLNESNRIAAQKDNLLLKISESMNGLKPEDVMGNL